MTATIKTKSNFKGLNGQALKVKELVGNRVSCLYFDPEFNREITIDFTLAEVVRFN